MVEFADFLIKESKNSSEIDDLDEETLTSLANAGDFFTFLTDQEEKEANEKKLKLENKSATSALTSSKVSTFFSDSPKLNREEEERTEYKI
ncbi:MAG: hypothetical protein H0U57_09040 [Tatlockia sp.]|nr:hypothetical protein [Tatlockia sp.]